MYTKQGIEQLSTTGFTVMYDRESLSPEDQVYVDANEEVCINAIQQAFAWIKDVQISGVDWSSLRCIILTYNMDTTVRFWQAQLGGFCLNPQIGKIAILLLNNHVTRR